jgi:hypothetical protein
MISKLAVQIPYPEEADSKFSNSNIHPNIVFVSLSVSVMEPKPDRWSGAAVPIFPKL